VPEALIERVVDEWGEGTGQFNVPVDGVPYYPSTITVTFGTPSHQSSLGRRILSTEVD
jgi:hypothetical protein